ncbi:MAG: twin-arginine translocase subunit TatB [Alphaproteobacteria bacterium]|nr:twin-arginine translocase subunit TatB [Alphaproteobacteria bacterium]
MFDVGWSEMLIIMIIALLLFGPKDLIGFMRQASGWVRKAQGMAREFQGSIDEIAREQEIQEAKKALESVQGTNAMDLAEKLDPTGAVKEATSILKTEVETAAQSASAPALDASIPSGLAEHPPIDGGAPGVTGATSWSQPPEPAGPPLPTGLATEPPAEAASPSGEPPPPAAAKPPGAADRPAA